MVQHIEFTLCSQQSAHEILMNSFSFPPVESVCRLGDLEVTMELIHHFTVFLSVLMNMSVTEQNEGHL